MRKLAKQSGGCERAIGFLRVDIRSAARPPGGKSGHHRAGCSAQAEAPRVKPTVTAECHRNKPPRAGRGVRVQRWGKSPPAVGRLAVQGKPLPVQDEIGDRAARPMIPGASH